MPASSSPNQQPNLAGERFRQQPHDNATVSVLSTSTVNDSFSARLTPQGQKSSRRHDDEAGAEHSHHHRVRAPPPRTACSPARTAVNSSGGEEDDSVGNMRDFDSHKYDCRARMTHRNNHHGPGARSSYGRHSSVRTTTSGTSGGRSSAGTSTGTGKSLKHVGNRQRRGIAMDPRRADGVFDGERCDDCCCSSAGPFPCAMITTIWTS
mmetsp:Transcript_38760/g.66178  ORF Transcript_38760/g.66178 Transcript_38760/m.66178 type:complete len:208 (-) Transcript_38760:341-964(-)